MRIWPRGTGNTSAEVSGQAVAYISKSLCSRFLQTVHSEVCECCGCEYYYYDLLECDAV
jgi:hypothetical protein